VSRRQHTTLILQVRIPVPAGKTQAATLEWVKHQLTEQRADPYDAAFCSAQTQVKITGRETTYL
jgi:hypothetical protein